MRILKNRYSVKQAVERLDGSLTLVSETFISNVAELEDANDSSLCFYESKKYRPLLKSLKAGLVIVPLDFEKKDLPDSNLFYTEKPYLAFNSAVSGLMDVDNVRKDKIIHSTIVYGENCVFDDEVNIGANVVIGDNVKIGSGTVIGSNCVFQDNVKIGSNCRIYPNTSVYSETEIGDQVTIHAGSAIGADGFGYVLHEKKHQKINHIGKVVISDNVEIGANTCIDRATIGKTFIGKGTKIDNLVQIGHNCKIGQHSVLCAQVGLAGNTEIGNYVYLAGQVGAAGHLKIGDGAMVGAQSGIAGNLEASKKYFGTPAIDAGLQKRIIVCLKRLPEIIRYFNKKSATENNT